MFWTTKSLRQGLSVHDSLPLVQLKYSLNNFCSQWETNDMQTRFYNIKCRGNHTFFFKLCDQFSTFGWVTFFPIPSLVSSSFGFWDIWRNLPTLDFTFFVNKLAVLLSFTVIYRRRHVQLLKQRAKSWKYYTRGTGHVSCDLCIAWCADNVRINNNRHRP